MGTWGKGNFDDDLAADFLYDFLYEIYQEIDVIFNESQPLDFEEYEIAIIPCKLDIVSVIYSQKWGGIFFPERKKIEFWQEKYLNDWELHSKNFLSSSGQKISSEFNESRRLEIIKTFDRLLSFFDTEKK